MRRPRKSRVHLPRKVRKPNTWDESPWRISESDRDENESGVPVWYLVENVKTGATYEVSGYDFHLPVRLSDNGQEYPPAYVMAEVQRQHSADELLRLLTPNRVKVRHENGWEERTRPKASEVVVIQRHVSSSGMYRALDLYNHDMSRRLTWSVGQVLGEYDERHDAVGVGGCGMDMHFATVYNLASVLYGDGYALTHRTV